MKITAVEAIPYAIPYRKPLRFASGEILAAEHVLVRVHTDDGLIGTADAPPRPFTYGETQASVTAVIEQLFALPGLGQAASNAIDKSDIPAVQGVVVIATVVVVITNLVLDVVLAALDPKVRTA